MSNTIPRIPVFLLATCLVAGNGWAQSGAPQGNQALELQGAISESANEITTQIDQIDANREDHAAYGPLSPLLRQWDNLWSWLDESTGLSLGFAYTTLFQGASNGSFQGARSGGAGDLDIFGRWKLLGDDDDESWINEGMLGFNLEYRHSIGASTPADLGSSIGSLWNTATGFNEQDFSLIQWWWQQRLFQDELQLRIGKLDLSSIFDAYRFNSANFFFTNQAFSDNPTIPFPENGLGAVAAWYPTDHWFLLAGGSDAEGRKTETAGTVGDTLDAWFVATTLGWRGPVSSLGEGLYQVTAWHSDKRSGSQRPSATGASLVLQQELGNGWVPYARYSFSSDNATDTAQLITVGAVAEEPFGHGGDRFGLSAGWGRPHADELRSQWVGELFYRFEPLPEIQITPSVQLIVNPSKNSDNRAIGIFGIRGRLNF
jgi:porin